MSVRLIVIFAHASPSIRKEKISQCINTKKCGSILDMSSTEFLAATTRSVTYLETLEALWIEELEPKINTKEEYKIVVRVLTTELIMLVLGHF